MLNKYFLSTSANLSNFISHKTYLSYRTDYILNYLNDPSVLWLFVFDPLTSATLIHCSRTRALCQLRSCVDHKQDADTVLASLLNCRTVARTDQHTPSRPFLSLWDHSEPRQWYGTRRTNNSWQKEGGEAER